MIPEIGEGKFLAMLTVLYITMYINSSYTYINCWPCSPAEQQNYPGERREGSNVEERATGPYIYGGPVVYNIIY
jgi:hypothetical protein